VLGHLLGRDAREHDALDLTVLAFATFKAARTVGSTTGCRRDSPRSRNKSNELDQRTS